MGGEMGVWCCGGGGCFFFLYIYRKIEGFGGWRDGEMEDGAGL